MGKGRNIPRVWLVVVVVVAVAAVGVMTVGREGGGPATFVPDPDAGFMAMGSPDAPIHVIEYSDFQCPFCGIFARNTRPQLIEEFVNTGRMRWEWRNFPVFGPFSTLAAHGTMCALEQGAFWAFNDAVFAEIDRLKATEKNLNGLVKIASSVGMDPQAFRACVSEERYADELAADFQEGRERGLVGTPTFIINGAVMVGAQPVETWRQVVEALEGGS